MALCHFRPYTTLQDIFLDSGRNICRNKVALFPLYALHDVARQFSGASVTKRRVFFRIGPIRRGKTIFRREHFWKETCRNKVAFIFPYTPYTTWQDKYPALALLEGNLRRNKVALFCPKDLVRHGMTNFRREHIWKQNLP